MSICSVMIWNNSSDYNSFIIWILPTKTQNVRLRNAPNLKNPNPPPHPHNPLNTNPPSRSIPMSNLLVQIFSISDQFCYLSYCYLEVVLFLLYLESVHQYSSHLVSSARSMCFLNADGYQIESWTLRSLSQQLRTL